MEPAGPRFSSAPTASFRTTLKSRGSSRMTRPIEPVTTRSRQAAKITFYDLSREVNDHFNGTLFRPESMPELGQWQSAPAPATFPPSTSRPPRPISARSTFNPRRPFRARTRWSASTSRTSGSQIHHWTVNAGLRWDFENNPNDVNYVTPPAVAAALRAYKGWQARGINADDYISNGHNRNPEYESLPASPWRRLRRPWRP